MASNHTQSRPQKRPGRPANDIRLNHFDFVDGRWRCRHCTGSYAKNTASGNLTVHMTKNHSGLSPIEGYAKPVSCPSEYVNMGYSPGQPQVHEPSTFKRSQSVMTSYVPMSTPSVHPPQLSPMPSVDATRQTYTFPDPLNTRLGPVGHQQPPNTWDPASTQDMQSIQFNLEPSASFYQENTNYFTQLLNAPIQPIELQFNNGDTYQDNSNLINPNGAGLPEVDNATLTQLLISTSNSVQGPEPAGPNPETVNESTKNLKRKQLSVAVNRINLVSLRDLEEFVQELEESGVGRREIQSQVENAILNNQILFNAFMRRPLDALTMIDSRFGKISIGLLGDGLIGERKDKMRTMLREKCDRRWEPCLFQVYIFSFQMRNANYCTIELGFQNSNSLRRGCILDCIELPPQASHDFITGTVLHLLADFGVENKLSDVSIRGNAIKDDLAVILKDKIKVKDQRLKIKQKVANQKNLKRIREYFQIPGVDHMDELYSLQMDLANYDSISGEIKSLYSKTIAEAEMISQEQATSDWLQLCDNMNHLIEPSDVIKAKEFLRTAENKCRLLRKQMQKLTDVANSIEPKLFHISQDVENHVYYLPTNTKERINLLRLIPLGSYQRTLKEVNGQLLELVEILQSYLLPSCNATDPVDELVEWMEDIHIKSPEVPNPFQIPFIDWERNYEQGLRICERYADICNYLADIYTYYNDRSSSPYVKELVQMNSYTPFDFPFEKFKRIAFLKAWKTFESTLST